MTDWWRAIEEELERRGDDAPDPWADVGVPNAESQLTEEQRAFLEQLAQSPIHGIEDDDEPI
jgi:hypothetical protein